MRLGVGSASSSIYTGVGLLWKKMRLDVSSAYHPQLGITPALILAFLIGKEKE
jgi:hypothetical protein